MSNYIGADWNTIPAAYTPLQMHDALKARLVTAYGWQLRPDGTANEDRVSNPTYFDVIPPSGETIGNSAGYDFIRVRCYGNPGKVSIQPYMLYKVALPQSYVVYEKTAGAVTLTLTIGSTIVSYTGSSTNTAKQNLWGLYVACKNCSDAAFTAFDISYDPCPPQNANDGYDYIRLVQKTPGTNATISVNSNVNGESKGTNQAANTVTTMAVSAAEQVLSVDLANGWIYFLSASKRGFTIGGKLNSAVQASISAGFANNAKALAAMPTPGRSSYPLIPIEAFVTTLPATYPATGYPSHMYALPATPRYLAYYSSKENNGHAFRGEWCNGLVSTYAGFYTGETSVSLDSSLPATDASNRDDYQVYRIANLTSKIYSSGQGTEMIPASDAGDIWVWNGTASEEQSILVPDPETTPATLTAAIDASSAITTITGDNLSNLRSSGYVVVGREPFIYTGNTGTQLTGVTRGQFNATLKSEHFAGDKIYQGRFFVKLLGAALDWGYSLPS